MVKELKEAKFVDSVGVNDLGLVPTPSVQVGHTPVPPLHIQIEEDALLLLKKLKQANIDFEIFLRGIHQRLEQGRI